MLQAFRRVPVLLLLVILIVAPMFVSQAEAQTGSESSGSPIDVLGKVVDHHYLALPGYELQLPRILLVDGEWHAYPTTQAALASGAFAEEGGSLVPADGSEITLDMSITAHLVYVWLEIGRATCRDRVTGLA